MFEPVSLSVAGMGFLMSGLVALASALMGKGGDRKRPATTSSGGTTTRGKVKQAAMLSNFTEEQLVAELNKRQCTQNRGATGNNGDAR